MPFLTPILLLFQGSRPAIHNAQIQDYTMHQNAMYYNKTTRAFNAPSLLPNPEMMGGDELG